MYTKCAFTSLRPWYICQKYLLRQLWTTQIILHKENQYWSNEKHESWPWMKICNRYLYGNATILVSERKNMLKTARLRKPARKDRWIFRVGRCQTIESILLAYHQPLQHIVVGQSAVCNNNISDHNVLQTDRKLTCCRTNPLTNAKLSIYEALHVVHSFIL